MRPKLTRTRVPGVSTSPRQIAAQRYGLMTRSGVAMGSLEATQGPVTSGTYQDGAVVEGVRFPVSFAMHGAAELAAARACAEPGPMHSASETMTRRTILIRAAPPVRRCDVDDGGNAPSSAQDALSDRAEP